MWIITVVVLLAGGLLGASSLIISKKPNARQLIDKLTPYQGWIGVVLVIWGVVDLIRTITSVGALSSAPFWMVISILTVVVELGLGFLLGYGLISQYALSQSPEVLEKGQQLRVKLAVYQGPLGLAAIVLAVLFAVMSLR
jgi:4-hydroxybenzoate polyprenyltransferase